MVFFLTSLSMEAQVVTLSDEARAKHFLLNRSGIAIEGYDPVSYWVQKPEKGKSDIRVTYKGVIYLFFSNENKTEFLKNPDKYEPEFGGWCAYAMGESGDKVEIDPKRYKIINGRLNLFYNGFFGDTLKPWNEREGELMPKAKENWKKITK